MSVDTTRDQGLSTRVPRSAPEESGARNGGYAARPAPGPAGAEPGPTESAPLVYRKQCFNTASENPRRKRYQRRSQSSRWLISDAHEDIDTVDMETGEITSDWSKAPRLSKCSWRIGSTVPVHAANGVAHFSGTERCSSIWACPVCSSVIRAERAREIDKAVNAHHDAGGAALFVTLTIRHKVRDPLKQSLDAVLGSWRKMLQGGAWVGTKRTEGMRSRYGVVGYIRSTEITYGENGWHPHIHAVILLAEDLSEDAVQQFGDEVHGHWARHVQKATGRMPTRQHGVDVQKVDKDGKVIGQYLSKMQDEGTKREKWGVSAELARTDVKSGRGGSFVPFELLDRDHGYSEPQRHALWSVYVKATKGRRAITWSRGLKDLYEVGEMTDEEIIEETESAPARWIAYGKGYDALRRRDAGLLAHVLDLAEIEAWADVAELLPGEPAPDFDLSDDDPPDDPDPDVSAD